MHPALQRSDVGEYIAVSDDNSARFGSRPGSKHNLKDVVAAERKGRGWRAWLRAMRQIVESLSRNSALDRGVFPDMSTGSREQFRSDLMEHAQREVRGGCIVHRNHHHS